MIYFTTLKTIWLKIIMNAKINIKICMGSACFARGNAKNLETIEEYINKHHLDAEVELIGARCNNQCSIGPNIIVNETIYNNVTKEQLDEILLNLHSLNSRDN